MADLASLGDLRGKRVLVRSDPQRPPTARRSPTTAASGVGPDDLRARRGGRASSCVPTSAGRRGAGGEVLAATRRRPARELLAASVSFATDTVGESARPLVDAMTDGDVVLLENLRFNPGETAKNDEERAEFADALAGLADAYVSDGFGVVHRKQASGLRRREAPRSHGRARSGRGRGPPAVHREPESPYAVVLGGAKVADKLAVIDNLMGHGGTPPHRRRDALHLPRGQGSRDRAEPLRRRERRGVPGLLERADESGVEIILPVDVVCGRDFSADTEVVTVDADAIPGRHDRSGHRAPVGRALRERARRRLDRLLERPDGGLRDGAVRRRHAADRAGTRRRHRRGRAHRRRRG